MKYIIYARVSPKGSYTRDHETSIDDQIRLGKDWITAHQGTCVDIVIDKQISASSMKRPGIQRIIQDIHHGADWEVVVTYRLNRISRTVSDGSRLFQAMAEHNKGFVSLLENIDCSSPMGRLCIHQLLAVSQWQRETIAEDTKSRMVGIAKKGLWPCRAPFGYKRKEERNNLLVPDPENAAIVKMIYDGYLNGQTTTELRKMTGRGKYSDQGIINILRNPIYIGKVHYAGQTYHGMHEPLIDQASYDSVQKMLPGRTSSKRPNAQKRVNLLSGILFCSCGNPMTSKSAKKRRYHYYTCKNPDCSLSPVPAQELEQITIDAIQSAQLDKKLIDQFTSNAESMRTAWIEKAEPELAETSATKRQLLDQQKKLNACFLNGIVGPENAAHFNGQLEQVNQQLQGIHARREELKERKKSASQPYITTAAVIKELESLSDIIVQSTPELKRSIIQTYIKRVDRQQAEPDAFDVILTFSSCPKRQVWHPEGELGQLCLTIEAWRSRS